MTFRPLITLLLLYYLPSYAEELSACPYLQSLDNHSANSGCFVYSDDRLLMVQQLNGLWNFPGGTAEAGEAPMCTAWRETLEETGWHAQVQHLLDTMPNGFHLFHCQIDHQQQRRPIDTTEVRSVRWFDRSELREIHWRFPKQSKQVDEWIQRARNLQLAH